MLYGDGVFEGIRVYDGCVFRLPQHLDRLWESAKFIMLEIPMTREEMVRAVVDTVRENNLRDCYVRLVVTRGIGDLGLDPRQLRAGPRFSSSPPTSVSIRPSSTSTGWKSPRCRRSASTWHRGTAG